MSDATRQVRTPRPSSPEQQVAEYAVLAEISRIISSTLNIDEIYEQFAHQVALLIPFDRLSIAAVDMGSAYRAGMSTRLAVTFRVGNGV